MKHIKKIFFGTLFPLMVLVLMAGCSSDSAVPTQTITGMVTDPAIEGATVEIRNLDGSLLNVKTVVTDENGVFTLTGVPLGDLSQFQLVATGGVDVFTGELNIELSLPLALQSDNVVISPLTSLISDPFINGPEDLTAAVKRVTDGLGITTVTAAPSSDPALMEVSLKVTLLRKEGTSFKDILGNLDAANPGVTPAVVDLLFPPGTDAAINTRIKTVMGLIDTAMAGGGDAAAAYQKALIRQAIVASLEADLANLSQAELDTANANIDELVTHLISMRDGISRTYLTRDDVVSTISGSGRLQACVPAPRAPCADHVNLVDLPLPFDATVFKLALVDRSITFSDSLKAAYYRVDNPITGNHQLVAFDAATGKQTVVKTNVIIGNRAFVMGGSHDMDKTVISEKKYGILLDPNQSRETRIGGSPTRPFEYTFFFDNAFKRYNVANPATETVIFDSSMLPPSLTSQGLAVISDQYTLFNNVSDPDNSYVALTAFDTLPDPLKPVTPPETGANKLQSPVTVRLVDGSVVPGRMIGIIKSASGLSDRILINFVQVHKPSGTSPIDRHLQTCLFDLSSCSAVTASGGLGDGDFFFMTESDTHIYLAKEGDEAIYAFDKGSSVLTAVTGLTYPAVFDQTRHLVGSSGHGGAGILSDFSALTGVNTHLSDGASAYLAINYDLDTQDPVGRQAFSPAFGFDVFVQKHAQVLKLTGTSGVKIFDNGDGTDHGDASDAETSVGHLNMIAVSNGRLFVEIGNYDHTTAGGTCTDTSGLNCSSLRYGYLNTAGTTTKTDLDMELKVKTGLRIFTARRIAPVAMNDRLFVSILDNPGASGTIKTYTLHSYDLSTAADVTPTPQPAGRSYMTKAAVRANGVFEGEVITWDSTSKRLVNRTLDIDLGSPEGVTPGSAASATAITSVFGRTSGVPLAGIGNLYALREMPGSAHDWHLIAGVADLASGLVYVDQVPTSAWLYD